MQAWFRTGEPVCGCGSCPRNLASTGFSKWDLGYISHVWNSSLYCAPSLISRLHLQGPREEKPVPPLLGHTLRLRRKRASKPWGEMPRVPLMWQSWNGDVACPGTKDGRLSAPVSYRSEGHKRATTMSWRILWGMQFSREGERARGSAQVRREN